MDLGGVIQIIRDRLAFNQNLAQDTILRHMDLIKHTFEQGADELPLPWFNFQPTATVTTVAGERTVDLPTGFVDFDDDFPVTVTVEGHVKMVERLDYHEAAATVTEGAPEAFVLGGGQMLLYPLPDDAYTLTVPCYTRSALYSDVPLTTTDGWTENFPMLLVEETLLSIGKSTRDESVLKMSESGRYRLDYLKKVEGRRHQLKSYRMGGRA